MLDARIGEVSRRLLPVNHTRAVDAARLLGLPFMCVHTPGDNQCGPLLQKLFDEKRPETVGAVVELLLEIPEYRHSASLGVPPKVVCGAEKNRCGKVLVDMTGGTEGSKEVFEKLSRPTSAPWSACTSPRSTSRRPRAHLNAVIAGHIASDNLGINLMLDEVLEGADEVQILTCSGFQRISRKK